MIVWRSHQIKPMIDLSFTLKYLNIAHLETLFERDKKGYVRRVMVEVVSL